MKQRCNLTANPARAGLDVRIEVVTFQVGYPGNEMEMSGCLLNY